MSELAKRYLGLKFTRVEAEAVPELSEKFSVTVVPTVVLLKVCSLIQNITLGNHYSYPPPPQIHHACSHSPTASLGHDSILYSFSPFILCNLSADHLLLGRFLALISLREYPPDRFLLFSKKHFQPMFRYTADIIPTPFFLLYFSLENLVASFLQFPAYFMLVFVIIYPSHV